MQSTLFEDNFSCGEEMGVEGAKKVALGVKIFCGEVRIFGIYSYICMIEEPVET